MWASILVVTLVVVVLGCWCGNRIVEYVIFREESNNGQ